MQRTPTGHEKTSTHGFLTAILHGGEGKGKDFMALQDGKFANEPDTRLIKETLGRLLGAKFGVEVKLIESTPVKRAGEATGERKEAAS